MISHKTLGHPAMLFGIGVVSFVIGLRGTMLIDDVVRADRARDSVQSALPMATPAPTPTYGTTYSTTPSGAPESGPLVSPDSFVGTWRAEWGGVQEDLWIHNTYVNGSPRVSKPGNWRVWGERYENGVLSFQVYGGDSNWAFTYWVTYDSSNSSRRNLRVLRLHDNVYFDGYLNATDLGGAPPEPTDSYSATPPEGVPGGGSGGVVGGVPGGSPGGVPGGYEEPAPSRGPVRLSGGALMEKLIDRVDPAYPPLARQARIEGAVILEVTVDENGEVRTARVVSGHPMLTQAAVTAVRQWLFEPTYDANDEPVVVVGTVTVNFKLSGEPGGAAASEPVPPPPSPPAGTAPAGLQPFVGTWTSKWADVTDQNGFTISVVSGQPRVTRTGNWRVSQERFDGRVLTFRSEGGDSNWAFIYTLEYSGPNRLKLRVQRLHDNQTFTGDFTR